MDTAIRVQIMDEAFCISYGANAHGKGMNTSFSSYGKIVGQTEVLNLGISFPSKRRKKKKLIKTC